MLWIAYLREGRVLVPTIVMTEAGFRMESEPVEVVSAANREAIAAAVSRAIERGEPRVGVTDLSRTAVPVVCKYAGVKSARAFERGARSWLIREKNAEYELYEQHLSRGSGWVSDGMPLERFPAGTEVLEVAKAAATAIHAAAEMPAWRSVPAHRPVDSEDCVAARRAVDTAKCPREGRNGESEGRGI